MAERRAELIRALADLGGRLELPAGGDPAAVALARIRAETGTATVPARDAGRRRQPAWLAVAAAVVIAVLVVAALPGPRAALGRLLGIGGVEIVTDADIDPGLSPFFDLGRRVAVDEAVPAFPDRTVAELGEPAQAYAGRPAGGTSLVWQASDRLPGIGDTGAGLIFTAFPTAETPAIVKRAGGAGPIVSVLVGGHQGAWVEGPHEMAYTRPGGELTGTRVAGNTLVWTVDGTTYRLESSLSRSAAVALASRLV